MNGNAMKPHATFSTVAAAPVASSHGGDDGFGFGGAPDDATGGFGGSPAWPSHAAFPASGGALAALSQRAHGPLGDGGGDWQSLVLSNQAAAARQVAELARTRLHWPQGRTRQHDFGIRLDMSKPSNVSFLADKLQATFEYAVGFEGRPPAHKWAREIEDLGCKVVGNLARVVSASNSMALCTEQESPSCRVMTFNLSTDLSASKNLAEFGTKVRRSVCIDSLSPSPHHSQTIRMRTFDTADCTARALVWLARALPARARRPQGAAAPIPRRHAPGLLDRQGPHGRRD